MTYVITETCIGVKGEACLEVCPEFAIFSEPEDRMSFIDPARCTDCGVCMAACVIGAIFPDHEVPRDSLEFIAINEQWFHHRRGVRKRVQEIGQALALGLP